MENTNEIMTTNEEIEVIETTEVEPIELHVCSESGVGKGIAIGGALALVAGLGYKFIAKPVVANIKNMIEQRKAKKEETKKIEVIDYDENGEVVSANVEESK